MKKRNPYCAVSFFFIIIGLLPFIGVAQQDAAYSQYMFNPFVVNPAYAGSRDAVSTTILYRSQWVGMNGAPKTGTVSIHAPIKATKMSWGLSIINDKIGPTATTAIQGAYAYRVRFLGGRLAFALRAGYYSSVYDKNQLHFSDKTDRNNIGGTTQSNAPNFDFGMYYNTPTFFLGVAASHLNTPTFQFNKGVGSENLQLDLNTHIVLSSGFVFDLSEDIKLKPSVYLKYMPNVPLNTDINVSVLIKKRVWLGVSTSSDGSLTGMVEINATDFIRIGYGYDMWLKPQIGKLTSHEIFIGYDFRASKKATESPKYL